MPFWLFHKGPDGTWKPGPNPRTGHVHRDPDPDQHEPQAEQLARSYSHERGAPEDLDRAYRALL